MKKKCLVIIPGIPFPPVDGHKLKIYNFILILAKHFDLHIISISREDVTVEQREFMIQNSYRRKHFKIGMFGAFFRLFKSIFSTIPFQVAYFTLPSIKRYIINNGGKETHAVLNLIRTGGYLDVLADKSIILDMVDSLSRSYLKSKETTSSLVYSFIYGVEGDRLVEYEKKSIEKVDLTLCVNQDDAKNLSSYGKVKWLPNGVKESLFNYTKKCNDYNDCVAFFGAMFYQPNVDAMIWFDKYVLDHLDPKIKILIIGARPSNSILNIAKKRKNVRITGFLDDPYIILNSCFAIIAPMQNGGGIQNKIIETMGMGKVNVLTSYAADPIIGAENNKHFIVENDPVIMAERINEVFINPSSFANIGKNAAILIKETYTWDAYEKTFMTQLNEINND
ncbi:glycosyltransferase [Pedobacter sp. PLR]|uniref:glycosyltransferase n=1 Tax=Pedobacter sp. PLR TaxID=2994465 RepID=UPI0022485DF9|nr:glycosyltransferase [Pedobacter sp. PLR]MCX2453365.1 glycosyltransferase [Pedobacter sp. PLR]